MPQSRVKRLQLVVPTLLVLILLTLIFVVTQTNQEETNLFSDASQTSDEVSRTRHPAQQQSNNGVVAPQEVVVLFKEKTHTAQTIQKKIAEQPLDTITTLDAAPEISELSKKLQVSKIEPIIPVPPTSAARQFNQPSSSNTDQELFNRLYTLTYEAAIEPSEAAQQFTELVEVELAQPNRYYSTQVVANDPFLQDEYPGRVYPGRDRNWNPPYSYQWNLHAINAAQNWSIDTSSIIVAVVDSGVDPRNPDIGRFWTNSQEVFDNIDNDGNGCIDDRFGCVITGKQYEMYDDTGHGTHVAGIISAKSNDGIGIAGVTNNTTILPVKVLGENGRGTMTNVARGIYYAVLNGADIINLSLGGEYDPILHEVLDYAHSKNVVIVVAAGNSNADAGPVFPASYKHAITVAASDENNERVHFSNYGSTVDVAAPGGESTCGRGGTTCANIISAESILLADSNSPYKVGERYVRKAGTSMAAPHVSGVAATLLAQNPGWQNTHGVKAVEFIEDYIRNTSISKQPNTHSDTLGWGVIQSAVQPPARSTHTDFEVFYPYHGQIVLGDFEVLGFADSTDFSSYTIEYKYMNGDWTTNGVTLANQNGTQRAKTDAEGNYQLLGLVSMPNTRPEGQYRLRTTLNFDSGKRITSEKNFYYRSTTNQPQPATPTPTRSPLVPSPTSALPTLSLTPVQETCAFVTDLTKDGEVNILDFSIFIEDFGKPGKIPSDINCDETVNIFDFALLIDSF